MRTVDFNRVLTDAIQLCGLDRDEFNVQTFRQMRDFASARLRYAWEYDRFPDIVRYVLATTTTDANSVTYVTKPADAGEILGVWDKNPLATTRALSIPFHILVSDTEERLILLREYTDGVYVEYRTRPPELNGNPWDSTTTYYAGSQVYFDSSSNSGSLQPVNGKNYTANFYECLATNTNANPETSTSNWTKIRLPYIFGPYLSRAIYADYLRSEGQIESANVAEAEAKAFLDEEIDKIIRQQGQYPRYKFIKSY